MKSTLDAACNYAAGIAARVNRAFAPRECARCEAVQESTGGASNTFLIDRWDALATALILAGAYRG